MCVCVRECGDVCEDVEPSVRFLHGNPFTEPSCSLLLHLRGLEEEKGFRKPNQWTVEVNFDEQPITDSKDSLKVVELN